jgi:hypothetical protein
MIRAWIKAGVQDRHCSARNGVGNKGSTIIGGTRSRHKQAARFHSARVIRNRIDLQRRLAKVSGERHEPREEHREFHMQSFAVSMSRRVANAGAIGTRDTNLPRAIARAIAQA